MSVESATSAAPAKPNRRHFRSSDIALKVKLKVHSFEGERPRLPYHRVIGTPLRHAELYATQSSELWCECALWAGGRELLPPQRTTHRVHRDDAHVEWNEWLTFGVTYAELPRDACATLAVRDGAGALVGGATFALFGKRGSLRRGEQRCRVWPHTAPDGVLPSRTPHKAGRRDARGRLELFRKQHRRRQVPHVAWLDELMRAECERLEARLAARTAARGELCLNIAVPEFELPVLHHSVPYAAPPPAASAAAAVAGDDGAATARIEGDPDASLPNPVELAHMKIARGERLSRADRELKPMTSEVEQLDRIVRYPPTQALSAAEKQLLWQFRYHLSSQAHALTKFLKAVDWAEKSEAERAVELMHEWEPIDHADALELLSKAFSHPAVRRYAVQRLETASDDELCLYLLQLVQAFPLEPKVDESPLVHFIVRRALGSLTLANFLQWYLWVEGNDSSGKRREAFGDVLRLFNNQVRETLINAMLADAKAADSAGVGARRPSSDSLSPKSAVLMRRAFKRGTLSPGAGDRDANNADDDEATTKRNSIALTGSDGGGDERGALRRSAGDSSAPNSRPTSPMQIGSGGDSEQTSASSSAAPSARADEAGDAESDRNGSGSDAPDAGATSARLAVARQIDGVFKRQRRLIKCCAELAKDVKALKLSRPKKIEKLREWIAKNKHDLHEFAPVPLPLDPSVIVCGINPSTVTVYKSAMQPLGLEFRTVDGGSYYVIYKSGDDLRQDQFVMQLIRLMDRLLKREQLELHLTPYAVLATSPDEGMVQRVDRSTSVAGVIRAYTGDIKRFLQQKCRPGAASESPSDVYLKSCAGYSVISYILGIGDRHLDNLLMIDDGRLFHIDFGYILGRDPKPYPPPMKLTREMIEGMGGSSSRDYQLFKSYCCEAFNLLRRSASLLLNLFSLMLESSVPDIKSEGERAVLRVQEKLRLELTPEEAEIAFQQLLNDSVSALFPVLIENAHRIAQYLRS